MSSKHLEQAIATLSAQVTQQNVQIAELQKQLTDIQATMSCGSKMVRIASENFEQSIKATLYMG
ncbi:hypothetical protein ACS3HL_004083 [Providencia stuartii]|uniref:hypothetical protein n=1 Tax=Providencia stuartii TaxID=588 RepID=UPI000D9ABF29|nr:hypothetical protein [Providencia stuartii]MBQ0695206.1 hypothetical protein [Providencia stuartii]SPY68247.1 Uncharacterised protein [Providencia stuartii]